MAEQDFVSRHRLIAAIREIAGAGDTGIVTILTDTRRSVLLRFSRGRLVQVHCRTRDVSDAVGVLNECERLKFTFVPAQPENRVEVMPVGTFLQMLLPGADDARPADEPAPDTARAAPPSFEERGELLPQFAQLLEPEEPSGGRSNVSGATADLKDALTRVALDYVGPMASFLVDDATDPFVSVTDSIERIARMIPDDTQANGFREKAGSQLLR